MRKEDLKHQLFTIPNILTYFRILCIPAIMYFTIAKDSYILRTEAFPSGFPLIGLIIMAVAASSDVFDGMIARKFNQGSDLGILLDPLADKLMHCCSILALVIAGAIHWAFILVLLLKEATMIAGGIFMANESKLIKANYMGKVASATISVAIIMSYFHDFFATKVFYLDWIILGVGLLFTYIAFFNYLRQAVVIINRIFEKKRLKKQSKLVDEQKNEEKK